ncbi:MULTISPECIES: DUF4148 domain-containing protein [Paraburkholderia]|uniref:DUF4148 domain-containing protein n=1 Tax=Paraburkholderia TaxID=1822464 RepID=UPI0006D480B0|nr:MULTISPECIES: DUF4148 domain-containing protein [Paraburkholderia]ALP66090.1 hypothetical protein AN416_26795 [Paraburkholderia caribensis]AMV45912.1 hypothetical protein ATN79_28640 [Paraburkholderia caribensis]AUT54978.1 DUF4148 domain-containing protein [Paraburkholderia caribensis]CAG9213686.1 conserved exported hypothetical protein [Paraburkholderia caribensis]
MKRNLIFFITASTIVVSWGTAFAQSNASPQGPSLLPATTGTMLQSGEIQGGQWVLPDSNEQGKTRAQVKQELIRARQDGQLAWLNKTIYAHH